MAGTSIRELKALEKRLLKRNAILAARRAAQEKTKREAEEAAEAARVEAAAALARAEAAAAREAVRAAERAAAEARDREARDQRDRKRRSLADYILVNGRTPCRMCAFEGLPFSTDCGSDMLGCNERRVSDLWNDWYEQDRREEEAARKRLATGLRTGGPQRRSDVP